MFINYLLYLLTTVVFKSTDLNIIGVELVMDLICPNFVLVILFYFFTVYLQCIITEYM